MAISPDGTSAYVTDAGVIEGQNSFISVLDTTTNAVTTIQGEFVEPMALAFDPDGSNVYISDFAGSDVWVVDTATKRVTAIPIGGPSQGIAVSPDGTRVYAVGANVETSFVVISTADNAVIETLRLSSSSPDSVLYHPMGLKPGS